MTQGGQELTRHHSVLRKKEADIVVGIVARLIVDYLRSGRAEGDDAGCDTAPLATTVADSQEVQE